MPSQAPVNIKIAREICQRIFETQLIGKHDHLPRKKKAGLDKQRKEKVDHGRKPSRDQKKNACVIAKCVLVQWERVPQNNIQMFLGIQWFL
jgi:hypothetical protein